MIRKLLFLAINTVAVSLSAQINFQDSSVQVITYWELGEKYNYTVIDNSIKFNGTDTTENETITYEVDISVIDSTADSYTVRWLYKNYATSSEDPMVQAIMSIADNIAVDIQIDEVGVLQGVKNWEEVSEYIKDSAKKVKQQFPDLEGFDAIMDGFLKPYTTKEGIESSAIKDAQQFHNFHGGAYKINEEMNVAIQTPNLFMPEKPFDSNISVMLEEIDQENYDYLVRSIQEVDPKQLTDATYAYLTEVAKSMGEKMPPREEFQDLGNMIETVSRIHNTGWVISSIQWKEVVADGQVNLETRKIILN